MNNENYFKDIFESIQDYRKIVLLIFLIQNDKNLLKEIGFSKKDINHLYFQFKKILIEEHENFLDYIKDQEQSILEKFFLINKWSNTSILYLKILDMKEDLY